MRETEWYEPIPQQNLPAADSDARRCANQPKNQQNQQRFHASDLLWRRRLLPIINAFPTRPPPFHYQALHRPHMFRISTTVKVTRRPMLLDVTCPWSFGRRAR